MTLRGRSPVVSKNKTKQLTYSIYSVPALEKELSTSIEQGLSAQEVLERHKVFGYNTLAEPKGYWLKLILRQFESPFVYLLLFAAVISFFAESRINALFIAVILLINIVLSFIQEHRAELAVRKLKQQLFVKAQVKRNGAYSSIDSKELVPGDVISLKAGDYIPADIRFVQAENLTIDESVLTGESSDVRKTDQPLPEVALTIYQAANMGFLSTLVVSGSGLGVVVATGTNSVLGMIASLTTQVSRESDFQNKIKSLSAFLIRIILITIAAIFVINLIIKGGHISIAELLLFSLALAIGITPEALPAITTVALTQGALELAKHKVLVKRLSALEDLGSITLLCTDKTGTLTENKMTVSEIFRVDHYDPLLLAMLASSNIGAGKIDPFNRALTNSLSAEQQEKLHSFKVLQEIAFDPIRRKNSILVENQETFMVISKGALEELLKTSLPLLNNDAADLKSWITKQGNEGKRTLAVAFKELANKPTKLGQEESSMHLAGVIAFTDPPKPTAKKTIAKAKLLGVGIKMLTGDSKEVACAIAKQVGLASQEYCSITGTEFEALSAVEQQEAILKYDVFARVLPEQKYQIVTLLKAYYTVGFLGEGINDAPALKAAHVALVVHNGTDIAREAGDIILLEKSLHSIIEGIAIGRTVFANTFKYIRITLACNVGNFYSIAIASLFIDFLPLLPLHILLINLLTDLPMLALAGDTVDLKELQKPPAFNIREIAMFSLIFGLVSSLFDGIFFAFFYALGPRILQTNWFIESILSELAATYSLRSRLPAFKAIQPSFLLLAFSIACAALAIILPLSSKGRKFFSFIKPTLWQILTIVVIVIAYFITTELVKLVYYRWLNHNKNKVH